MKKKKAFTLIELIAVLVILAILALIVTPLVMSIIKKSKDAANKRSIDAYGKAAELAVASSLIDKGTIPTDLSTLKIDYTGYEVNCNVMQIKENGGVYLSECTVNGKEIKDKKTEDGWYHYNERDLTNEEYIKMYGDALKASLIKYYDDNDKYPYSYEELNIKYRGKKVKCNEIILRSDKTVYLTECKVNNTEVKDDSTEDGWYHYGEYYSDEKYVDLYGSAIKESIVKYYNDNRIHPSSTELLNIDYIGKEIECNQIFIRSDDTVYLTECLINDNEVKDSSTEDGWYHYGENYSDKEYVALYANSLQKALSVYYNEHNEYPDNISGLSVDYVGKTVTSNIQINPDGTVYLTNINVDGNNIDYAYGADRSTAVKAIISRANSISINDYENGDKAEVYTFSHPATAQTGALKDFRYIGSSPNNYVSFNNEMWRIIGVFNNGTNNLEQRVKIVSSKSYLKMWNSSYYGFVNYWTASTLNTYLNSNYYDEIIDKEMIADSKYYLGGFSVNETANWSGENLYTWERGTLSTSNITNWSGNIALIYPSDYVYTYSLNIDNSCFNDARNCNGQYQKSWLNKDFWLLTSNTINSGSVYVVDSNGNLSCSGIMYYSGRTRIPYYKNVYPTLYLKSSVKITSGDGSEDNPYQLSL